MPPLPGTILVHHSSCPPKLLSTLKATLSRLEKKIFPQSEAFNYTLELSKQSIGVILAYNAPSKSPESVIAYLVYQRQKRIVWLHKLAVVEHERGRGVGRCLVQELLEAVRKGGAERVLLWVDEGRGPARGLYEKCGFVEVERLVDYYGPGRTAVKMEALLAE